MTEFKVGDKVRVLDTDFWTERNWKVEDETFVSDLGDFDGYYVGGQKAGELTDPVNLFWSHELELIEEEKEEQVNKFKTGDRVVKVTKTHFLGGDDYDYAETEAKQGQVGTITGETSAFAPVEAYYVDWDDAEYAGSVINGNHLELVRAEYVLTKPGGVQPERKKVTRKQVDKVLRAAKKANDLYADPNSHYDDYAAACDNLHKILEKIANA